MKYIAFLAKKETVRMVVDADSREDAYEKACAKAAQGFTKDEIRTRGFRVVAIEDSHE